MSDTCTGVMSRKERGKGIGTQQGEGSSSCGSAPQRDGEESASRRRRAALGPREVRNNVATRGGLLQQLVALLHRAVHPGSLCRVANVVGPLKHKVGVRVHHHLGEHLLRRAEENIDDGRGLSRVGRDEALLHEVGAEFVLRELDDATRDVVLDEVCLVLLAELEDVLQDEIAMLVPGEFFMVTFQGFHHDRDTRGSRAIAVPEHALHETAGVLVDGQGHYIFGHDIFNGLKEGAAGLDPLRVGGAWGGRDLVLRSAAGHLLEAVAPSGPPLEERVHIALQDHDGLLEHMGGMGVPGSDIQVAALEDELVQEVVARAGGADELEHLLHHAATVGVHAQVHDDAAHFIGDELALLFGAVVQKVLHDIIAEQILHHREAVVLDLIDKRVALGATGFVHDVLQIAAAVGVLGELQHMAGQLCHGRLAAAVLVLAQERAAYQCGRHRRGRPATSTAAAAARAPRGLRPAAVAGSARRLGRRVAARGALAAAVVAAVDVDDVVVSLLLSASNSSCQGGEEPVQPNAAKERAIWRSWIRGVLPFQPRRHDRLPHGAARVKSDDQTN
mmetsp:Transcript_20519/g.65496  ORF Transcript_20519/g.65496 Transcript_20519/m.65496 type:complete len:560 (+) Transcript_20519:23-1702(+)